MLKSFCSRTALGALFLAAGALSPGAWGQTSAKPVVSTAQVRAELMAHAPEGIEAGKTVWVGLQLQHQPEWHTYWKNSGDSGLPTVLEWKLPPGVTAGDIAWPTPHKIPIGNLANYGYTGTVLLPVPLTIAPDFKPPLLSSDLDVKLKASWLVCRKECIPEEGVFELKVPVKSTTAIHTAEFDASFAAQPKPLEGTGRADIQVDGSGKALKISVTGLPAALQGKTLGFFPEVPEVIETAAAWTQAWSGSTWTASVPLAAQRSQSPDLLPVVLASGDRSWRAEAKVGGTWPPVAAAAGVSPALEAALKNNAAGTGQATAPASQAPPLGLLMALVGALLGGLILNLMPCVFPVLAIKMVSFSRLVAANTGGNARAALRTQGLSYTAGVVVSFLALGGLLQIMRMGGEQLGWGFQLQSPAVVATLAVLFTWIALNLMGVYDFGMFVPSKACTVQTRHPVLNAFLSGVLAVAIASPCTAPFMGASLGFAVSLPGTQALLVFAAMGLGMALPYLVASLIPALARLLPRPGPWMEVFRRFMAFPMLATVAWLVWVLGQQTGIDGAVALLGLLLLLAMVAWAYSLQGRARTVLTAFSVACVAALLVTVGPNIVTTADPVPASPVAGARWQPWQPGRVEQLQAAGQPVFVDFTAAWCVTCQYNKKTTLSNHEVLAALADKNVALLHADWTRRDPAIGAALSELGRNGVPLYVFYKAGQAPIVLSEVLSVDEVRSAIARL